MLDLQVRLGVMDLQNQPEIPDLLDRPDLPEWRGRMALQVQQDQLDQSDLQE